MKDEIAIPCEGGWFDTIFWSNNGIYVGKENSSERTTVISGFVQPIRGIDADDVRLVEWILEMNGQPSALTLSGLLKYLNDGFMIQKRQLAPDVLSAVVGFAVKDRVKTAQTFGVYDRDGTLLPCFDPYAVRDRQIKVLETVQPHFHREPTKEDIERYVSWMGLYPDWLIKIALGHSIFAPFAYFCRTKSLLYPNLGLYGKPESGKSGMSQGFTLKMFGIEPVNGGTLKSSFRLAAIFDSIGAPITCNESHLLDETQRGEIKAGLESSIFSERGKRDLTLDRYWSRAVLQETSNGVIASKPEDLKRYIIIKVPDAKADYEERKKNFIKWNSLYDSLEPIGYAIIKELCKDQRFADPSLLLKSIRDRQAELNDFDLFVRYASKRSEEFAILYQGLIAWDAICQKTGVDWELPDISDYAKIIEKVEPMTWNLEVTKLDRFNAWFSDFRLRQTRLDKRSETDGKDRWLVTEEVNMAENKLYIEGSAGIIQCYWVTNELLLLYNKANVEYQYSNLVELSQDGADLVGLSIEDVVDSEKGARRIVVGNRRVRTGFIPKGDT